MFPLALPAGRMLQRLTLHDASGGQLHRFGLPVEKFTLPALPPGLYRLRIQDDHGCRYLPLRTTF